MQTLLLSFVVFALAFLALALGIMRGRHCLNCSCKAARRIMGDAEDRDGPRGSQSRNGVSGDADLVRLDS
jgi:hypothetical protein